MSMVGRKGTIITVFSTAYAVLNTVMIVPLRPTMDITPPSGMLVVGCCWLLVIGCWLFGRIRREVRRVLQVLWVQRGWCGA